MGEATEGLIVTYLGGACPTQAEGTIFGNPFYFRARHGTWDLTVTVPGSDPVMPAEWADVLLYREGEDPAQGWMEEAQVLPILQQATTTLRERRGE